MSKLILKSVCLWLLRNFVQKCDTDFFVPTGEQLVFAGAHSKTKIALYDQNGAEYIGTEANTMTLSGTNIEFFGASGSNTPTLKMNGTTVFDSTRRVTPYEIRLQNGDDTPAGTQFSNVIKGQGTNRTIYFDGNSGSVSTWYGVGNDPYAAIDVTSGVMDFWINNTSGTFCPRQSKGLVYCPASNKPNKSFEKES